MVLKKKLLWVFRRHPALYYIRYALLSRNLKSGLGEMEVFGDVNDVSDIPELFFEVNAQIGIEPEMSNLEKAIQIGKFIIENTKGGPALSLSAEATLTGMLNGNGGVCSDFALVFNVFCLLNNIPSREYNSVDKIYNPEYGHAFNEIYDNELEKWIAIDINKGIYFFDNDQNMESVTSLFAHLRKGEALKYNFFSDYQPPRPERLEKIYSKETIAYLVSNYRIKDIDKILERYSKWPMFAVVIVMMLKRKNYHFSLLNDNYKQKLFPLFYPNK